VTDTNRLTRAALPAILTARGIRASPEDLFTATLAGAA
jgi:hypothetical protein